MNATLPMFPLNTVIFPGVRVPLRVFEDRYRALVHRLLRIEDPTLRLFGSVAIREGYEVGDHGAQSLHRIGCRLQLTEVAAHADGSFDVVGVGRDRIRLDRLDSTGPCPLGAVTVLPDRHEPVSPEQVRRAQRVFADYAAAVTAIRGTDPHPGSLPEDPEYLAWTLAASAPLPLPEQQQVLEAESSAERLTLLTDLFLGELTAMQVLPSLPASRVARTGWSPN